MPLFIAIAQAFAGFLGTAAPLVAKLATARQEEHAAILDALQAATVDLQAAIAGLPSKLVADDAAADAALKGG